MITRELRTIDLQSLHQLLFAHPSVDAAAVYGSVARGDAESYSDVDLLLVCRASRKLPVFEDIRHALEDCVERLSLTIYSERELRFLHSAKSLFLLHLSREAVLLFDKSDFLRALLSNFRPKDSYKEDFERCMSLMDPLKTVVFGAPNNLHRLSYIYSLFRVFGVYLLAEKGIYEFSKARMVQMLANRFPDQREKVDRLSGLRALNSNFFTGGLVKEENEDGTTSLLEGAQALASLVRTNIDIVPTSYSKAVAAFDIAVCGRTRALDYRLRMWFLLLAYDGLNLYCAEVGRKPLRNLSVPSLLGVVESKTPEPISRAVAEITQYLERYPLKYFLTDDSKIGTGNAQSILRGMDDALTLR